MRQRGSEILAMKPAWATHVDGLIRSMSVWHHAGAAVVRGSHAVPGVGVTAGEGVVWVVQVDGVGSTF